MTTPAFSFEAAVSEIRAFAEAHPHMGWRFLCCPRATLNRVSPIAFITLNPGGSGREPGQSQESCEDGSAYVGESENWKGGAAALQDQVQELFEELNSRLHLCDSKISKNCLLEESLTGYFIPYRTQTEADFHQLPWSRAAVEKSIERWGAILQRTQPKLVLCIGKTTFQGLRHSLDDHAWKKPKRLQTGWGTIVAEILDIESIWGAVRLVRLPHLSRYRIFGRDQGQVVRLMDEVCGSLRIS